MSIESEDDLRSLRRVGRVVAETLAEVRRRVRPGMTTAELDGYVADACESLAVGAVDRETERLCATAAAALRRGMSVARAGTRLRDVGAAVERVVEARGFSVLRELQGHGVGRAIHEPPEVPSWDAPLARERLAEGLVMTIEPSIAAGGRAVVEDPDGWTIRTRDGARSAHAEHTIVITHGQPLVVTAA
jgi:methionyl aminopeptidase